MNSAKQESPPETTHPLRLAAAYGLLGLAWIFLLDRLLASLVGDPTLLLRLSLLKDLLFLVASAGFFYLLGRRLQRAQQERERTLQEFTAGIAGTVGEEFFQLLVRHLTGTLGAGCAFVGELSGEKNIRTVAARIRGREAENLHYPLEGSPCETVVGQELRCYPQGLRKLFPRDQGVRQLGFDSYIGMPLDDSHGRPLGLLVVMDRQPLCKDGRAEELLRVFAVRASAELERMRSRKALQSQFDQVSAIFGALSAVVYVADLQTHELLYLNRHGEEIFGRDWGGRSCYQVIQGERNAPCSFCSSPQPVEYGEIQPPVLRELCNPRNGRWYQCIDRAIRWPDGRLARLEIAIDISERKEMERMKDELLSSVSHELRTPLTAILGFAEFLLENPLPYAEQEPHLQTLYLEAERLNGLIGNFLQLQRLKSRREVYRFQPLPPQDLLERAIDHLRGLSAEHPPVLDCPAELPPLRGDLEAIDQVLENLVANAVKFSPQGGAITLGARLQERHIVLRVEDGGVGIPQEELERIFAPLHRLDNTDRRRTGGAGLGLTLVREIVLRHQGRVWAESSPGRGSTFFVELPVMDEFA